MKLSFKIILPIILISALLILLNGCFGVPTDESPGYTPGTITGIIAAPCCSTSAEPVSETSGSPEYWCYYCQNTWDLQDGIEVVLTYGEDEVTTVFTNEDGEFAFTNVEPGENYVITAYCPDFDDNRPLVKDVALEIASTFDTGITDLVSTSLGLVVDFLVLYTDWGPEDISLDEVLADRPNFPDFPKFKKLVYEVRRVVENCEVNLLTDDEVQDALCRAAEEISKLEIGCGPGYTSSPPPPPPTPSPPEPEPEFIIPETTKIADEETEAEVIDVTLDYSVITFARSTTQLEGLEVGDILFIGVTAQTPYGLLRKVTNITRGSRADDTVTVSTEFSSIEEAVEELHVSVDIVLTQDDIDYERLRLPPGISMSQDRGGFEYDHTFNLSDVSPIYEGDPATTIDDVTIDGEIYLNYEMIFNLDIGLFNLGVEFRNIVESYTDLNVTVGGSLSLSDLLDPNPIHLFTIPFIPIPVAPLLVITPVIYINIGLDGEIHAELTVGVTIDQTGDNRLESGFEYDNGTWHSIKNSPVFDLEAKIPELNLGGTIKPYMGPQLELIFNGCAGVYGSLYGYLELQADINDDPWWCLYGGFEGIIGAQLKILSFDLGDPIEWTIFNPDSELLRCADGPFADIQGQISGSVKDAVTQSLLPDVSVKVYDGNSLISSGTTDSNSVYSMSVLAGSGYRVEFTKSGYIPAIYYDVSVVADVTTYLETVLQIDDSYSGEGNISGTISNALTGGGVSGLTINLREGINVTSGTVIASATTESGGDYSIADLNAGYYTAEVSGTGYNTTYFTVICIGGATTANQDATITPILSSGETRIILTWGETPSDLDSHLTGPLPDETRFHMYYPYTEANSGSPWPEYVKLDLDDVSSYGPETTTIYQQIPGVYRFSVHDYTNKSSSYSTTLSNSEAQVRVYLGENLIATFNVPVSQEGTLWTVFEMDGDTIIPINTMTYESDQGAIRQASTPDAELMKNLPPKR